MPAPSNPPVCLAVVTTVPTRADADELASAMVEKRLAACAEISAIDSYYHWEGMLQHGGEFRVLFKTLECRYDALQAAILARHPYSLPAVHGQPLAPVSDAYARWIAAEVGAGGST